MNLYATALSAKYFYFLLDGRVAGRALCRRMISNEGLSTETSDGAMLLEGIERK